MMPQKWAVRHSALDNLEDLNAPPEMPQWAEDSFPSKIVGTSKCASFAWDEEHNIFKGNYSFEPAYLTPTLEEPFYRIENSSFIALNANQWIPAQDYSTEPALLRLSLELMVEFQTDFEESFKTFKKAMYEYRCARRNWEFDLLSNATQRGNHTSVLVAPSDSFNLGDAKDWLKEEDSNDGADIEAWWTCGTTTGPLGATAVSRDHCEGDNWVKNAIPPKMRNLAKAVEYLEDKTGVKARAKTKGKKPQRQGKSKEQPGLGMRQSDAPME